MAERPIFVPARDVPGFVKQINFAISWAGGFALTQKQKNVRALHAAAAEAGYSPLLEVSTKSEEKAGRHLSAFHLKVRTHGGEIPLESAYQGSKVFEVGGPYTDIYKVDAKTAKGDPRLRESGRLIRFEFEDLKFPLEPKTAFYDWLYLNAIYPHRSWLKDRLTGRIKYAGFTDIEFNPSKSLNCQARSCALFVALIQNEMLDFAIGSPKIFIETIARSPAEHLVPELALRNDLAS
jgi:hypothetical protein